MSCEGAAESQKYDPNGHFLPPSCLITRLVSLKSIKACDLGMGTIVSFSPMICSVGVLNDGVKTRVVTGSINLNPQTEIQNCLLSSSIILNSSAPKHKLTEADE